VLTSLGIHPSRAMGQNFLIDRNILNIIVESANLDKSDCVLEVGPGLGSMTEGLLSKAGYVIAVEKDKRLCAYLEKRLGGKKNLSLVHGDALSSDNSLEQLKRFTDGRRVNKVVSNFPYSAASRVMVNFARSDDPPDLIIGTVQQEVAERLTSDPGGKEYGLLTVYCSLVYDGVILKDVSNTCFWPKPEVTSSVIRLKKHGRFCPSDRVRDDFYKLTKYAFTQRRKQLAVAISSAPPAVKADKHIARGILSDMGFPPDVRPEKLGVDDWLELVKRLAVCGEEK